MTTYYVGPNGDGGASDAAAGTSWETRWATVSKAESTATSPGDVVYFGPGEHISTNIHVNVSGSAGNPSTWIGDYTGANTSGVKGAVYMHAHDPEQWEAGLGILNIDSDYRTFQGFIFHMSGGVFGGAPVYVWDNGGTHTNLIFDRCIFHNNNQDYLLALNKAQSSIVKRCVFLPCKKTTHILINNSSQVNDAGLIIESCYFGSGTNYSVYAVKTGGVAVNGCSMHATTACVRSANLVAGSTALAVRNSYLAGVRAFYDGGLGEIDEDYNTVVCDQSNFNTANGSNSHYTDPSEFDMRVWADALHGGTVATVADVRPGDVLLTRSNGGSLPSVDLRGAARTSGNRGALDYNASLAFEAGSGGGSSRRPRPKHLGRG